MMSMQRKTAAVLLLAGLCSGCVATAEKESEPTNPVPALSKQATLDAAKKAYQQGDYQQALEHYREVVAIDNYHRKANYNITIIHLELMIKGMEFVGQYINNTRDASEARAALDELIKQAGVFTSITAKYME